MNMFTAFLNAWTAFFAPQEAQDEDTGQAWGRFPERLSDGRDGHTHLNHL